MNPEQIKLIQDSFAKIAPVSDRAAGQFYVRLFEIAPELRPLFKGEMGEQGRKFMSTLTILVTGLKRFEELKPSLGALARQHASYGVRSEHYRPLGEALIWALEQGLGDAFTAEMREAWQAAYAAIADTMNAACAKPR